MIPTEQDIILKQRELIQVMNERISLSDQMIKNYKKKTELLLKQIDLLKLLLKQNGMDVDKA